MGGNFSAKGRTLPSEGEVTSQRREGHLPAKGEVTSQRREGHFPAKGEVTSQDMPVLAQEHHQKRDLHLFVTTVTPPFFIFTILGTEFFRRVKSYSSLIICHTPIFQCWPSLHSAGQKDTLPKVFWWCSWGS